MTTKPKDSDQTDIIDVQATMDQYSGKPDSDKITKDIIDVPVSMVNQADFDSIQETATKGDASDFVDVQAPMDQYNGKPDSDKITMDIIDVPVSMINQEDFDKIKK
jgi:hypothetical protein